LALHGDKWQSATLDISAEISSCIDLDHCIAEGSIQPWAQEIIMTMDTYTEYSPSWNRAAGTGGVHLLVEGKPPGSKKAGNIEVYGEKHYLTITTNHFPGTPTTTNPG